ncbi:MAG: RAD55 family ATPase, partial [Candidatus Odinarchaeia archaeon]
LAVERQPDQVAVSNRQELAEKIDSLITDDGETIVVIDSWENLVNNMEDKSGDILINFLNEYFRDKKITLIIVSESEVETHLDYIADTIIKCIMEIDENRVVRYAEILKAKGVLYKYARYPFIITPTGVEILSYHLKIKPELVKKYDPNIRISTGIKSLDEILEGGLIRGSTTLITGNTGTGKSTIGLHFIYDGLKNGENCLIVSLDEEKENLFENIKRFGFDLEAYEKEGKLIVYRVSPLDIAPAKIFSDIKRIIEDNNISRMFFSSLTTFENVRIKDREMREFMLNLKRIISAYQVTTIFITMSRMMFAQTDINLFPPMTIAHIDISSLVDTVILNMYWQKETDLKILITILKMRGGRHSRKIYHLKLSGNHISVEPFTKT